MPRKDITGARFGKLVGIELHSVDPKNETCKWSMQCDCGNVVVRSIRDLRKSVFSSCGCSPPRANWQGYGEISKSYWNRVIKQAKERSLPISITIEEAWDLFLVQKRKCALSKQVLVFPYISSRHQQTASLDRINSSLGYTPDNVQWVHKYLNIMKGTLSNEELLSWCCLVADNTVREPKVYEVP